jgi:hypothetical protein
MDDQGVTVPNNAEEQASEREGVKGGVPYNWNKPTKQRTRDALWNPDNPKLFPPKVFGAGWTFNFYWFAHPGKYRTMKRMKTN